MRVLTWTIAVSMLILASPLCASAAQKAKSANTGAKHAKAAMQKTASLPASAADQSSTQPDKAAAANQCDKAGEVTLAGEVVLRIHSPAGGLDCEQRADAVQRRIVDSLSIGHLDPKDIFVKRVHNEYAIFVRNILMITADPQSAKINHMTTRQLADVWCKNLRKTIIESLPMSYR